LLTLQLVLLLQAQQMVAVQCKQQVLVYLELYIDQPLC
jgi:hypothetical protein